MAAGLLRTPESRFQALPGWTWQPQFIDLPVTGWADSARMAFIDEGPRDAAVTVLCLHGNPSWGYLYRHMLPVFRSARLRVVVPDLIGFGRSDKPADEAWHRFGRHRDLLLQFVRRLDLRNVLLVVQDWGGLLGLTLPMALPERFTRLLVMNTTLGTGAVSEGFKAWRAYSDSQPDLAVGRLLLRGRTGMSGAEAGGYDAPFPDATYKAALRAFPRMVPDAQAPDVDAEAIALSQAAESFWRRDWTGDSFMAIGAADPVLGEPVMRALRECIRGCPEPLVLSEAGHFVPEWGEPVARAALAHFGLDVQTA